MSTSKTITLVTVCDNQFVVLMAALLKSIEINHKSEEEIDVYIVNDGISKKNIDKLNDSLTTGKLNLIWKTMSEAIPPDLKIPLDKSTFPSNIYARICIPYFIPKEVTKAIYLDVDMIMLEDVSKLWGTDMGTFPIAAVSDRSEVVSSPWGGIKNYKELGLDPDSKYFNSGMFILNPPLWREQEISKKIFKCAEDNLPFLNFADQYILNVIFNKNWLELNRLWNCYPQNSDALPYLIHFTGIKPIYTSYNLNSHYKDLFFDYLNQTKWSGLKPKHNLIRMLKKSYNKAVKKLASLYR